MLLTGALVALARGLTRQSLSTKMAASRSITLRFRTKVGMWRVDDIDPYESSFLEIKARLASEKHIEVPSMSISMTFGGSPVDDSDTPASVGAKNGQILFMSVTDEVIPAHIGRKVTPDGDIVALTHQEMKDKTAFRPGGVAMRDIKKHWTWMDFEQYQKAFEFTVVRQKEAHCKGVLLDAPLLQDFQAHAEQLGYQQCRIAILYGLYRSDNEVEVLASYEPMQVWMGVRGCPAHTRANDCLRNRERTLCPPQPRSSLVRTCACTPARRWVRT